MPVSSLLRFVPLSAEGTSKALPVSDSSVSNQEKMKQVLHDLQHESKARNLTAEEALKRTANPAGE